MILDKEQASIYIDVSKIDWEPTAFPGIWIKKLYEDATWSPDGCIALGVFEKPNEFLA